MMNSVISAKITKSVFLYKKESRRIVVPQDSFYEFQVDLILLICVPDT